MWIATIFSIHRDTDTTDSKWWRGHRSIFRCFSPPLRRRVMCQMASINRALTESDKQAWHAISRPLLFAGLISSRLEAICDKWWSLEMNWWRWSSFLLPVSPSLERRTFLRCVDMFVNILRRLFVCVRSCHMWLCMGTKRNGGKVTGVNIMSKIEVVEAFCAH